VDVRSRPADLPDQAANGPAARLPVTLIRWAAVLATAAGLALPLPAGAGTGSSTVALTDDDQGLALFDTERMHPGRVDSSCVTISATGRADPTSEVRLTADVTERDLAPYLVVTVERGRVDEPGNCSTFVGQTIWSGTLAQMPAVPAPGIATGWRPAIRPHMAFRFTVTVLDDPRAQRRAAEAAFVWRVETAAPGAGASVPATGASPARPGAAPIPGPGGRPVVTGGDRAAPSPPTASAAPRSGDAGGHLVQAPPLAAGPSVLEQLGRTVRALVQDGRFPLLLLVLTAVFVLLQGALDRRDPKLALARLRQDLSVFHDFPRP